MHAVYQTFFSLPSLQPRQAFVSILDVIRLPIPLLWDPSPVVLFERMMNVWRPEESVAMSTTAATICPVSGFSSTDVNGWSKDDQSVDIDV